MGGAPDASVARPPESVGRTRDFALALGVIAVVALVIRVAYVVLIANDLPLGQDSVWYTLVSGPLSEGQGFIAPGIYFRTGQQVATAGYPPGYPALLALVTKIANPDHETFRLAGALLGALCYATFSFWCLTIPIVALLAVAGMVAARPVMSA